ncbi:MAG: hypothetical protein Fur0043_21030 [Anaerolineales bacterium]
MSKKSRRQKPSFPWPLIALGAALLAVAAILLVNQNSSDGSGTPAIAVDQQKIDYGTVKFNTNLTFTIKVTNTGTGTLRFQETPYIEVLEGC